MFTKLAWLALAGALGTLARYGVTGLAQRLFKTDFPVGTLVVNVVGCLLFGTVWALAEERLVISREIRFIILTGFMGAFTTFSTFAFEASGLLRNSEWWYVTLHFFGHNGLGIVAVVVGMAIGKLL